MAVTYVTKQVEMVADSGGDIAEQDLYEVPSGVSVSKVVTIIVTNRGIPVAVRVSQSVGGGATADKDYIYFDTLVPANDTLVLTTPIFGNAGDIFRVKSGHENVTFQLHAQES